VTVITGTAGRLNVWLNESNIKNSSLTYLRRNINLGVDIRAFMELKKMILAENPDLVACHSSKAGIIVRLVCTILKIPCTFTVHGWSCTDGVPNLQKTIYLYLERILGAFSNKLITVCQSDEDFGIRKKIVSPHKIVTIHNGVKDLTLSKSNELIKPNSFIMVMSARFQNQKDHLSLVQALIQLKEVDWILYLLGDGDETIKEIKKLVANNGLTEKIKFIGYVSNVHSYLAIADLFLLISKWEGLPISILEAMSMKLPIIASDVGGVNEQVYDGENGFLVARNDVEAITQKIKYLFENREIAKKMGERSRELYLQQFSIATMVDKTEAVYKSLIK
jgi:glycosyltransferase involved in cell wall biosynthesis